MWDINNIGLIKLAVPVDFNDKVGQICLPAGRKSKIGDKLMATGWVSFIELVK